jgi:hypothetical protein
MATTTTRRVEVWADQYSDVAAFAEEGDALNETFRRKGLCRMGTVEIEAVAPTWGTEQEVRQEVRRRVERAMAAAMTPGRTRIISTRGEGGVKIVIPNATRNPLLYDAVEVDVRGDYLSLSVRSHGYTEEGAETSDAAVELWGDSAKDVAREVIAAMQKLLGETR